MCTFPDSQFFVMLLSMKQCNPCNLIMDVMLYVIYLHMKFLILFNFAKELALDSDQAQSQTAAKDIAEGSADASVVVDDKVDKIKDKDDKDKEKTKEADKDKVKEKESERKVDSEKDKVKGLEGTSLDGLLQRLPNCVSRDLIDQLTVMTHLLSQSFTVYIFGFYLIV